MHASGGSLPDIPLAAWAPFLVVALAFQVFCVVDIFRHDVRNLPKWAWVVICLASNPAGGIIYLLVGRDSGTS